MNPRTSTEEDLATAQRIIALMEQSLDGLRAENAALRAGISAIHRRAQRNEGASHREDKLRENFEKQVAYHRATRDENDREWVRRGEALKKIVAAYYKIPGFVREFFS